MSGSFHPPSILVVFSLSCLVSLRSGTISVTTLFPRNGHPSLFLCTRAPLQAEGWASAYYYVSSGKHLPLPQVLGPGSLRGCGCPSPHFAVSEKAVLLAGCGQEGTVPFSAPVVSCVLTDISLLRLSSSFVSRPRAQRGCVSTANVRLLDNIY